MKFNERYLLLLSTMSVISGCVSLADNPYYRVWHDRAYALQGSSSVTQQFVAGNSVIPEAEPIINGAINVPVNMQIESVYSVESDPFKAYNRSSRENYNNNQVPPLRDYSSMDNELR